MTNRTYLYLKTNAPTSTDDTGAGYSVGDVWLDETNNLIYQAIDVSASAAIWIETVGRTLSQTLTNKTISLGSNTLTATSAQLKTAVSDETGSGALVFATSPALVTPTGIVKGDVGLGNVDNTSDTTKNAATVALTNKTIGNTNTVELKDTLFTLQDDGDTSKKIQFELSGISASTTRTLTVPNASFSLVGTTITQTITNKTVSMDDNTIGYTPSTLANWTNATDPGDAKDALDQLANRVFFTQAGTMSDDTAISFTPNQLYGKLIIQTRSSADLTINAEIMFRADASAFGIASYLGSNAVLTTGALAGTTGTDTKFNISIHTDGKIYIENRRGGSRFINYYTIGVF